MTQKAYVLKSLIPTYHGKVKKQKINMIVILNYLNHNKKKVKRKRNNYHKMSIPYKQNFLHFKKNQIKPI